MRRRFHTLDVFTDTPLHGNPLAVVHDADGLDAHRMQAVAREFNLSETVFVLEPRDPVNSARIRIFTPDRELPFAGHPTVGAAVLLAELRGPEIVARQDLGIVLEQQIGLVHCTARRAKGRSRASFTLPRLPDGCGVPPSDAALAAALGLDAAEIGFDRHRPAGFSAGVPFTLVPLRSPAAVDRIAPDAARWPHDLRVYAYARDGAGFHARMFTARSGIVEDPATGSAAAAFAGALMRFDAPPDGDHAVEIRQGVAMGRPSLIGLGLEVEGGALVSASIGGGAVILCDGTIDL
ncbi:PhzF family phenazine biosynthesis protein [Lichenibacterium minor]|jgi:trans-2,3-dihydro-3-hydroxyanthranilate isomerase|uniref:PhzF family phenazine biosynthesis protein n=1 Tax=Lichenibacterium minor TaxID=2316528 RepID=A0A4Q2UA27_9HYPH|nr:PhzF family phenazine biosynthesis protein [Lichenibacterium minor]RYC33440.1 PhzF family phenazine biosynthesis protein [Lichenibacterium minor]